MRPALTGGKTFLEWHDENGQKITEIPTGSTGDRVITAYWNWPVHLHYLDKDNNEIESATLYVSELEPGACVLPTGEKTGYDFDGWYGSQKGYRHRQSQAERSVHSQEVGTLRALHGKDRRELHGQIPA